MRVLVFGGTGYIGSHAAVVLQGRGHEVELADNFSNSTPAVAERIGRITGRQPPLHRCELRDPAAVGALLDGGGFDAVLHFAALKAVGESCAHPLMYFDNNIAGTIHLLQAMQAAGCRRLVFSSSATVYGEPDSVPITEDAPLRTTNPYGRTKLVMEQLIGDVVQADPALRALNLRYFNPVGAHPSGLIGESPTGVPNNLMPFVCQVASGQRTHLGIFGNDWPTVDGTGVRDYIHVMDLAEAHADALDRLDATADAMPSALNLGTGRGTSVLELVQAFQRVNGVEVPYEFLPRRSGDVAEVWADPARAESLLGWRAERDLDAMCRDAWHWQRQQAQGPGSQS